LQPVQEAPASRKTLTCPLTSRLLLVVEEGGDLGSALGSGKDVVVVTEMFFFPLSSVLLPPPPDHPAPLVLPVTLLQVPGPVLGWGTSIYLSSSLCHHRFILMGL